MTAEQRPLDALIAEIRAAGPCPEPEGERMTAKEIDQSIEWHDFYRDERGARALRQLRADLARLAAEVERRQWQPIATAPQDGTVIDLWIVGNNDTVDFDAPEAKKIRGKPIRHGRAAGFRWAHNPPNAPNWYPRGGLGFPLSPEVTPMHWMPLPEPAP